jgi:hypothetical protein
VNEPRGRSAITVLDSTLTIRIQLDSLHRYSQIGSGTDQEHLGFLFGSDCSQFCRHQDVDKKDGNLLYWTSFAIYVADFTTDEELGCDANRTEAGGNSDTDSIR